MAYTSKLGATGHLTVENRGDRTYITLQSSSGSQQQSQGNSLQTGQWTAPPTLFRTSAGFVLRLEGDRGQQFVQIQSNQIGTLNAPPSLADADVMPMERVQQETSSTQSSMKPMEPMKPMQPMKPMEPMQPMKMGDMEMQSNPMQMRMGDMEMQMGKSSSSSQSPAGSGKRFCTQCGAPVESSDRFCAACGHRLVPEGQ